jgi:hypothetical protein
MHTPPSPDVQGVPPSRIPPEDPPDDDAPDDDPPDPPPEDEEFVEASDDESSMSPMPPMS